MPTRTSPLHNVSKIVLTALVGLLSVSSPGAAATPGEGHIGETAAALEWQGATFTAATNAGNAQGCFDAFGRPGIAMTTGPAACDVYTLHVDLSPAYWQDKSGGVRVQISGSEDVDLYIYRRNADGTRGPEVARAATSAGSESALIEEASGAYYVVTTPYTVIASGYRGAAEVAYSAHWRSAHPTATARSTTRRSA